MIGMLCLLAVLNVGVAEIAWPQRPNGKAQKTPPMPKPPALPADPKLQEIHRDFILKAERLAMEYERKKDLGSAQAVYESLLRIAPDHALADQALKRVLDAQAQDKKLLQVSARGEWQDTGIQLIAGMPVHLLAKGAWKVVNETGPKGIEIPDAMKVKDNRIRLGTLIGAISSSGSAQGARPFAIGESLDFTADTSGTLYLRMYDVDPTDNEGFMHVLVRSTFAD